MNKKYAYFIILFIFLLIIYQPVSAQPDNRTLFAIDYDYVSIEEFSYIYKKNHSGNDSAFTKSDIDTYLDLYINFKLKVKEARSLGLDTLLSYKNELKTYRVQLIKPYLTEKDVTKALLVEAYDRMKYEVDVSHILIKLSPDADPEDTLKAYRKAIEIKTLAEKGEDFGKLAVKYSEEPMVNQTKGHLGYFTAFQMVYPFENAAYNTPVEEISIPVRTRFGYHVLFVHDKRPGQGKVGVSHIMIRFTPGMNQQDSVVLRNRIFEIHERALSGYAWDELCLEYSEDMNTKDRGGKLSPFGVGEMAPNLAEAAFTLTEPGKISDPVMTTYGWHILRLNDRIPIKSFEALKPALSRKVEQDSRSDKSHKALITKLKQENGFVEFEDMVKATINSADSSAFNGSWRLPPESFSASDILFTLTDSVYTIDKFENFVNHNYRKLTTGTPATRTRKLYVMFSEYEIIEYEKAHLETKYPDFGFLMNEYREGILLFEIMDQQIWSPASEDTVGLKNFYVNNLSDYTAKETASLVIFTVSNDQNAEDLLRKLKTLITDSAATLDTIIERTESDQFRVIKNGTFTKQGGHIMDEYIRKVGVYVLENDQSGIKRILAVNEYNSGEVHPFKEIKGNVIADYQKSLEKEWIASLKKKYHVKIEKRALKQVYRTFGF